jgi:hypothetical protein
MTPQETAQKRNSEGRCIVCNEESVRRTRGLCPRDYERYRKALLTVAPEQRDAFEELLISKGQLLASRQGARLAPESNVFVESLEEFLGKSPAEQLADDMLDEAEAIETKRQAAKKTARKKTTRAGGRKKKG